MRFAHTLLFVCPECNLPVAISRVSHEKNFEAIDSERLRIKCSYCEKSSEVTAVMAKKHYVEEWSSPGSQENSNQ
jgi:aspartate carbamoyltransferase regulatory subunit